MARMGFGHLNRGPKEVFTSFGGCFFCFLSVFFGIPKTNPTLGSLMDRRNTLERSECATFDNSDLIDINIEQPCEIA